MNLDKINVSLYIADPPPYPASNNSFFPVWLARNNAHKLRINSEITAILFLYTI